MPIKTISLCETCIYGSNNTLCTSARCKECKMLEGNGEKFKCGCTNIRWGQECPHYVKEASR